jgi:hypothetical protein
MIALDAAENIEPHSTSEVTFWHEYVIDFSPVSIETRVCKVTLFVEVTSSRAKAVFSEKGHVEVTSSRAKAVFSEKGHKLIASFVGLTYSKLSDNIGRVETSLSIVVSAYVVSGYLFI